MSEQKISEVAVVGLNRASGNFETHWKSLSKSDENGEFTLLSTCQGENNYPFKADGINKSIFSNEHHSTCLLAKSSATVGLGFLSDDERKNGPASLNSASVAGDADAEALNALKGGLSPFYLPSKAETLLDELTDYSWQDVISQIGHDYYRSGNAFMEVARDKKGKVTGIWHLPWFEVKAFVEDQTGRQWHWRLKNQSTNSANATDIPIARWGDKKRLLKAIKGTEDNGTSVLMAGISSELTDDEVHELIHFRNPMGLHKIYGYPEWLAATQPLELISAIRQYKYDFFLNRGVPEFAIIVTGAKIGTDDWKLITDALGDHVGAGKSHKSFAINLAQKDVEVKIEKLGADSKSDTGIFQDKESLAADIVTSHRVPPMLANILIPGKLGASNEFPNALMAFQVLTIDQNQRIIQKGLSRTLGSKDAKLGLQPEDMIFRKITDLIDVNKADTVSRMREPLTEANAKGRDLDKGVKS